jgi:hypothetical protein
VHVEFVVLQCPVFYGPVFNRALRGYDCRRIRWIEENGCLSIHRNEEVSRTVRITWIAQNLREIELAVGRRRHIRKPKESLGGRHRGGVRDPQRRLGRSVARLEGQDRTRRIVVAVGTGINIQRRQYRVTVLPA